MSLKIIICSYKANEAFSTCLFLLSKYGIKNNELLIYENSPEDYDLNRKLLDKYKINYINNPNGTHADTMNRALIECTSDYALLLDSDCFCLEDPRPICQYIVERRHLQLFGDICGDRGGFHIHKRVHPWYCFVDLNFIKHFNIQFVDFERIKKSGSESFVDTKLLASQRNPDGFYYDAGSSMYEDVIMNGGICADIGDRKPYIHVEGSSWRDMFPAYQNVAKYQLNWINKFKENIKFDENILNDISKKGA